MTMLNRRSGKASVRIAWLTTLLSITFIVLIVNRDALQSAQPQFTNQVEETVTQPLLIPTPVVDVLTDASLDKASETRSTAHQALYAQVEPSAETLDNPEALHISFQTALAEPVPISSFDLRALGSVNIVAEAIPSISLLETPSLEFSTSQQAEVAQYDMSPSIAALEHRYGLSQGLTQADTPFMSTVVEGDHSNIDFEKRFHDTQVRLALSELKVAIYEGQSRASLRTAWTELTDLLGGAEAVDPSALEPELESINRALAGRTSARKLISAVHTLQEAIDRGREPEPSERFAEIKPF